MTEESVKPCNPNNLMKATLNMASKPVGQHPMMIDLDYSRRNKTPRPLSENERARLEEFIDSIHYSPRYSIYLISFYLLTFYSRFLTTKHVDLI